MIEMTIDGLADLDRRLLDVANDKLADKAIYSALSAAATPIVKEARQRASVAPEPHEMKYGNRYVEVQPGLLASSIRRRRVKNSEKAKLGINGLAVAVYVGKGTKQKLYPRYWHFVEYGTVKMPAVPFLRPAFDNNWQIAVDKFKQKLGQNLDKLGV